MRISRFAALLLACALLVLPAAGLAASTSLSVAIVADDHLALRPLELNHRDVVSLLNLVYEGLFEIDDNYQPQPKLAYAYSFSNDGRKLQVTLRQDVTFHNGEALTSATATVTPAAVENYFNIYVSAQVCVPKGCCLTVAMKNTSTQAVNFANSNLTVERIA